MLERLLYEGHRLGLGVYTNSSVIKDTIEKDLGFPCTLIELKPDKKNSIVNTKLLILDGIEIYNHKPTTKELSEESSPSVYWDLYNTKTIKNIRGEKK